jgi:hypothetical protein
MSVHERTDIDDKGTNQVTGVERGAREALVDGRSGRGSWGK